MPRKNPSTRWFFKDWVNDQALSFCSLEAQGAWMRMLAICADNDGYLLIERKQASLKALAHYLGVGLKRTRAVVRELEQNGVFSRTENGIIFNRRMVRSVPPNDIGEIVQLQQFRHPTSRTRNPHARAPNAPNAHATGAHRKLPILPSDSSLRSESDSPLSSLAGRSPPTGETRSRRFKSSPMNSWAKGMYDALAEREENRRTHPQPNGTLLDR